MKEWIMYPITIFQGFDSLFLKFIILFVLFIIALIIFCSCYKKIFVKMKCLETGYPGFTYYFSEEKSDYKTTSKILKYLNNLEKGSSIQKLISSGQISHSFIYFDNPLLALQKKECRLCFGYKINRKEPPMLPEI